MINPTELRIGNFVSEYGKFIKVESGKDIDLMYENWEPISLTPEILEKCGFKETRKADYVRCDNSEYTNGLCVWTENDILEWCETPINTEVKYLHQLQNAYFIFTGEELNISL